MPKNYYLILGVNRGADLNKIKKAYRTVIKKYHPDITHSHKDSEKLIEIREAYETLSDRAKREEHDKELDRGWTEIPAARIPATRTTEKVERREMFWDRSHYLFSTWTDDFLEGFLPGFFDLDKGAIKNKGLYFEAILSPREAAEGGLFPVKIPVFEPCPSCRKTGQFGSLFCPARYGYGRVRAEREFSLSIPPKVNHGTRVQLSREDIGLRKVRLHVLILIEPYLGEEW